MFYSNDAKLTKNQGMTNKFVFILAAMTVFAFTYSN